MKDLDTTAQQYADEYSDDEKHTVHYLAGFRAGHAHRDQQVDDLRHFVEVEEKLKLDAIDELAEAKQEIVRLKTPEQLNGNT